MTEIFNDNYRCYGYRRLHAMLRHKGQRLSEKVVRRLMVEEQLVVSRNRRRRYSSYCGEIGPAPDNLLARDFKAAKPNQKWLTDIAYSGEDERLFPAFFMVMRKGQGALCAITH